MLVGVPPFLRYSMGSNFRSKMSGGPKRAKPNLDFPLRSCRDPLRESGRRRPGEYATAVRLFPQFIFYHRSALHHEFHMFELGDVGQGIDLDGNDVGELAGFDRTDAIAPAHQLGGIERR